MTRILVLGAGMSSSSMIRYLLDNATQNEWSIIIADRSKEIAKQKASNHPAAKATKFDVYNEDERNNAVKSSDIVISMLPPGLHFFIAMSCLKYKKPMVTASYVSDRMKELDADAKKQNILLLNEMGVDPGIDHMSAMMIIDKIKAKMGVIKVFETHTGGLVAPKHDTNPWNYKLTWNPRNVVLAGSKGAQFLHNGKYKYIPYHNIFRRTERLYVLDLGEFESYPNRDSLKYKNTYGLEFVKTMFRGTVRRPGFCKAWNSLVKLGATDDTYLIEDSETLSYRQFTESFLPFNKDPDLEKRIADYLELSKDSEILYKLRWLGLFSDNRIGLRKASPAYIIQKLIMDKWGMDEDDKDMIVMQNQFEFEINKKLHREVYSMIVYGEDSVHTAMAKTVGLPVGIATKLILNGKIKLTGVHIPIKKEFYEPVMKELEENGIKFIKEDDQKSVLD